MGSPPPGPRVTTALRMPFVAGVGLSMPLSFVSPSTFGSASVTVEETAPSSGWPAPKLALSISTV